MPTTVSTVFQSHSSVFAVSRTLPGEETGVSSTCLPLSWWPKGVSDVLNTTCGQGIYPRRLQPNLTMMEVEVEEEVDVDGQQKKKKEAYSFPETDAWQKMLSPAQNASIKSRCAEVQREFAVKIMLFGGKMTVCLLLFRVVWMSVFDRETVSFASSWFSSSSNISV